mmetsp:Transcript_22694/g.52938  ORF Transcript_22694/g.52938 Transcript_22694/m.52938 type:complete len:421 (+) Transcript_22694:2194-3456(+)
MDVDTEVGATAQGDAHLTETTTVLTVAVVLPHVVGVVGVVAVCPATRTCARVIDEHGSAGRRSPLLAISGGNDLAQAAVADFELPALARKLRGTASLHNPLGQLAVEIWEMHEVAHGLALLVRVPHLVQAVDGTDANLLEHRPQERRNGRPDAVRGLADVVQGTQKDNGPHGLAAVADLDAIKLRLHHVDNLVRPLSFRVLAQQSAKQHGGLICHHVLVVGGEVSHSVDDIPRRRRLVDIMEERDNSLLAERVGRMLGNENGEEFLVTRVATHRAHHAQNLLHALDAELLVRKQFATSPGDFSDVAFVSHSEQLDTLEVSGVKQSQGLLPHAVLSKLSHLLLLHKLQLIQLPVVSAIIRAPKVVVDVLLNVQCESFVGLSAALFDAEGSQTSNGCADIELSLASTSRWRHRPFLPSLLFG